MMDPLNLVFLVRSFKEPWNEGYKNIAKYIYEMLKNTSLLNICVLQSNEVDNIELYNFDLIHIFNYYLPLTFYIKKIKLCPIIKQNAKRDLNRVRIIMRNFLAAGLWDVFLTTTPLLKREVKHSFPWKKVHFLPPPIPIDHFKRLRKKNCLLSFGINLKNEEKIVVYTGRVNKQRMISWLGYVRQQTCKNVKILIAISESPQNFIIKGDNVTFIPFVKDIREIYSIADLLIYPVQREGAVEPPLTVLEAMSCGCIVAAYKHPITSNLILNGYNGYLFSNPKELVQIVNKVTAKGFDGEIIGKHARETIARNYSFSVLQKHYIDFYERIARGRNFR